MAHGEPARRRCRLGGDAVRLDIEGDNLAASNETYKLWVSQVVYASTHCIVPNPREPMAEYTAVASVGASIEALLTRAFTDPQSTPPVPDAITRAVLARPGHARPLGLLTPPTLSIMLYRVAVSPVVRNSPPMPRAGGLGFTSIALNLHYLLTAWGNDAVAEHRIIARALQALEQSPILSGALLHPSTDWGADDTVQLVAEDLPLEQLLTLHALGATELRPSICCVARVARVDIRAAEP